MNARLIVKGNKFQAARAAAERGLPLAFENENDGLTVGLTVSTVDELNAWVCEDTKPAPFPVGSLLLWTPIG